MNVREAFDRSAQIYDRGRRQLVPCFDDFYSTAIERLPFPTDAEVSILDLGAGTGLLSLLVSQALPRARFTLLDVSAEMLNQARQRFAAEGERFRFVVADFGDVELPQRHDAIVSALAIHHLSDEDKRALFARVFAALKPGGVFVNADQVLGPTPAVEREYEKAWERQVRERGVGDADLAAAMERMLADRTAPVGTQLEWLREAGFSEVDCWYKFYRFAVFSGVKPA